MRRLGSEEYPRIAELAGAVSFGRVYPSAVVLGRQSGEIYEDGNALLIWHRCGFAWLPGDCDEGFLGEVSRLKSQSSRRMMLFTHEPRVTEYFEDRGAQVGSRLFFEHRRIPPKGIIPEGYEVCEMGAELFGKLSGQVVPTQFWDDSEQFCRFGKGFCITKNGEPAAWAFSASCDGEEVDIGIMTAEAHRGQGLAYAAAELMLRAVISDGRRPVWACISENKGSRHIAEKLGFEVAGECRVIK